MPNIKISDLPRVPLPLDAPNVFLEVQTVEGGEDVSRRISADDLASSAPGLDATFVTISANANLPNERVLTAGTNISLVDGGPNSTITINVTGIVATLAGLSDVDLTGQAQGDLLFNVDGTNWEDTAGNLRIDFGLFEFISAFTYVGTAGIALRNANGEVFIDNSVLGGGLFQYSVAVGGNDGIRVRDNGLCQFGMSGGSQLTTLISGVEVDIVRNGVDQVALTLAPAAGGLSVNNTLTGAGLERVLTIGDLVSGFDPADDQTITGDWTFDNATFNLRLASTTNLFFRNGADSSDVFLQNLGPIFQLGIAGADFGSGVFELGNSWSHLKMNRSIVFDEQASRPVTTLAGDGQIWVRNDAPNVLMFTDDDDTDFVLNAAAGVNSVTGGTNINDSGTAADPILNVDDPLIIGSVNATSGEAVNQTVSPYANVALNIGPNLTGTMGIMQIDRQNIQTRQSAFGFNATLFININGAGTAGSNTIIGGLNGAQVEVDFGVAVRFQHAQSGTTVAETAAASAGGFLANNQATGAGLERVLTTADLGGGVGISGTPVNNQIAIWVNATDIEGDPDLTFAASVLTMTNASGVLTITRGITDVTISNLAAGGDIFYNTLADHVFQIAGVTLFEIDNGGARFLFNNFGVFFEERGSAGPDLATYGQVWVESTTPQRLTFTDEAGVDKTIMNLFDAQQVDGFQDFRGQNLQQAGFLRFTDNINLEFGTGIDVQIDWNGTNFTTTGPAASVWLVTGFDQLRIDMPLGMNEQAAPDGNVAGVGQWWVRSAAPARPMFTDDTDVDQEMDPSRSDLNTQNGNYTFLITDKGRTIYKASGGAGETYTIPASGAVAYQIGTWIAIDNDGGGDLTIAITTDVLVGTDGATGSRTLGDNQRALIQKIGATRWRYQASDL